MNSGADESSNGDHGRENGSVGRPEALRGSLAADGCEGLKTVLWRAMGEAYVQQKTAPEDGTKAQRPAPLNATMNDNWPLTSTGFPAVTLAMFTLDLTGRILKAPAGINCEIACLNEATNAWLAEPMDRLGHHGLSCSSGAGRLSRHAALNDILRRGLVSANVPAALEPQIVRSDGKRPDGMSLISWKTGRALVWDATCTDTLAASYLPATTKCAGAAADARERLKLLAALVSALYAVPVALLQMPSSTMLFFSTVFITSLMQFITGCMMIVGLFQPPGTPPAPPRLERLVFFICICMGIRSLHQLRNVTGSPHSPVCHAPMASAPLGDSPLLAAIVTTRKLVDHARSTRSQRFVHPWTPGDNEWTPKVEVVLVGCRVALMRCDLK
ncbi:hypothetical protein MSG28_004861 [Choristoneura fumiferana]|uniref:Uncharacterized protein n=1 Tax=Choristoneura fumiferana TaxID=7141 RepID=A0ACC0K7S8_CHOFU|nr:hypothetical protein MSG28_004861 [Choristoneura fumiferana]